MSFEPPIVAISQRVVEVTAYREIRDCLDQAWTVWAQTLGYSLLPIPNRLKEVASCLRRIRPAGIILSGGNNLALPAYDDPEPGEAVRDAYPSRDETEKALAEYAMAERIPLLGCCRGMQFLQAFFGGKLIRLSDEPLRHVATEHEVAIGDASFAALAGTGTLKVNSFHNFGIRHDGLASSLRALAVSNADQTVEAFAHNHLPIIGIMWHPERTSPSGIADRRIATGLFNGGWPSAAN